MVNSGPPNINFINNSTVLFEGKKVQLICISTNDPDVINPLKVTWYNSNDIQLAKLNLKHVSIYDEPVDATASQVQSVLTFDPVKHSDTGKYTCQASNHYEFYTEATISLTVECENLITFHL